MSSQWWVPAAQLTGGLSPSSTTQGGGGGGIASNTQSIQFRSPLDARRAAKGQLSQAEYPDGYLGNIIDRRSDRLIQAVTDRLQKTQTQRGVHKGAIIDPRNYYWPAEDVGPDDGMKRGARAQLVESEGATVWMQKKNAPKGEPITILVNNGKSPPRVDGQPSDQTATVMQDPLAVTHYGKMLPKYRTGN